MAAIGTSYQQPFCNFPQEFHTSSDLNTQFPAGIGFLVQMRGDLLAVIKSEPSFSVPLRALSEHLRTALGSWFSPGLVQLQRITWGGTSGDMLERIMKVTQGDVPPFVDPSMPMFRIVNHVHHTTFRLVMYCSMRRYTQWRDGATFDADWTTVIAAYMPLSTLAFRGSLWSCYTPP